MNYLNGVRNDGRDVFVDVLKALAIILVVVAHCIQFGSGQEVLSKNLYYGDPVFKFITSFHMPLFMLISGYLFAFSVGRRSSEEVFFSKLRSLVLPLFSWAVVVTGVFVASGLLNGLGIAPVKDIISQLVHSFFHNLWFLWAVFWSSCVVLGGRTFFKDSVWFYCFVLVITFFLPDEHRMALYKFMYPYFVIGYFFNKSVCSGKILSEKVVNSPVTLILACAVFVGLLLLYGKDSYVYTSGYRIFRDGSLDLGQLGIDCYRFFIGLVGSVACILLMKFAFPHIDGKSLQRVAYIGMNSLGIYILSSIIFNDHLLRTFSMHLHGINYGIIALESVIVIAVTLLISVLIKRFRLANMIFLGGRK